MKKSKITTRVLLMAAMLLLALNTVAAPQEGRFILFETFQFRHSQSSNVHEDRTFVVTKESEWRVVWDLLNPGDIKPDLPDVDFSKNTLIAAFRGQTKPWEFSIKEVFKIGKNLTVKTEQVIYNPLCSYPAVITTPYHIIIIKKISKKLQKNAVFEVRSVVDDDCFTGNLQPRIPSDH